MCICTHIQMCTHVHTYRCAHALTSTHVHTHTHTRAHIYPLHNTQQDTCAHMLVQTKQCAHPQAHLHTCKHNAHTHTCTQHRHMNTQVHTCSHICTYAMHTHVRTQMHIRVHNTPHTCTHTRGPLLSRCYYFREKQPKWRRASLPGRRPRLSDNMQHPQRMLDAPKRHFRSKAVSVSSTIFLE